MALALTPGFTASAEAVKLKAAGSLRDALTEISEAFAASGGAPVEGDYAPSGLLREWIEAGEPAHLFASANMAHPEAIAATRGGEVRPFARNTLCALARDGLELAPESLVEVMLRDDIRVGIATPGADPSGDYAWELFARAGTVSPGVTERLRGKTLRLTGGPDAGTPPQGLSIYAHVMAQGAADIFLTYCTNAVVAVRQVPGLAVVDIPEAINIRADYGLIVLDGHEGAAALADYILSPEGLAVLAAHGFGAPR